MKKMILYVLLVFSASNNFGQHYEVYWTKSFTEAKWYDMEIIETIDGTYIFVGQSENNNGDVYLAKVDGLGQVIWEKYYGDISSEESGNAIIETKSKHFLIAGFNQSDLWILKVDQDGNLIWEKKIGDLDKTEKGLDIVAYDDNSYMITGSKYDPNDGNANELWLAKIDSSGNLLWQKTYGTPGGADDGVAIQKLDSGELIIAGNKFNPDNASWQEAWIIKTNSEGDSIWSRKFFDSSFYVGSPIAISESDEIILVYNNYYPGHGDVALVKLNSDGSIIWNRYINNQYSGYSIEVTEQHNLIFCGSFNSTGLLFQADSTGDSLWSDTFTESTNFYSMNPCSDKGLILLGAKNSSFSLTKMVSSDIEANFSTDSLFGRVPFTCNFKDSSSSNVIAWQWDFENDGIIDSYEKNPSHTYVDKDSFSVKLIVSNGVFSDTLIKQDFIVTYHDIYPVIFNISDVPEDQGGWVIVDFAKSTFDTDSLVLLKNMSAELYTVEISEHSNWIAAATTGAYGKSLYSVIVPTMGDSTARSDGIISFRVIANMDEGNFASNIMSGYSIDNLHPSIPQNLTGYKTSDNFISLSWFHVSDPDFDHYKIYKSMNGSQFHLHTLTIDTAYIDSEVSYDNSYQYYLSAVDFSGNNSDYSNTVTISMADIEADKSFPTQYYLSQNYPNPFNPGTLIKYGLVKDTHVRIEVYDVLGNRVKEIVNDFQVKGEYTVYWNGENALNRNVSSGIYYYKILTDDFSLIKNMIKIK